MSMLEGLPTVEEMMAALNSPTGPEAPDLVDTTSMELSVEDMIREIFNKVMTPPAVS